MSEASLQYSDVLPLHSLLKSMFPCIYFFQVFAPKPLLCVQLLFCTTDYAFKRTKA